MKKIVILTILLLVGVLLASCATTAEQVECPDCPVCPEPEACPDPEPCPEVECPGPVGGDVPYESAWATSGHADVTAEAFRHWDEDDPAEVSTSCAKCHSTYGYLDFLGVDGTEFGVVDNAAATDSTVECAACHNDAASTLTSVVMPSGLELTGLGDESRCMQCHQGRESKISVDGRIESAGLTDFPDTVSEDIGFANIHYFVAAAVKYGTLAKGGYEYDGNVYDANFAHVEGYETCIECHDPHTLEVKAQECASCHGDTEYMDIRMLGSGVDFDGDGDVTEGIAYEIQGLQEALYSAIQGYAADTAGSPIIYDSHAYPYFFIDTDGDGAVTEGEANYGNRYASWTPRLLKATYNYQVTQKDPGGFAHGGKYIIQLLYDSIEDLDATLVASLKRIDHGHFAGSEEAFRHWDGDDPMEVSSSCARCHSADGLPMFLTEGVNITTEVANGFTCATCHDDLETYTRYEVSSVTFPSGAKVSDAADANTLLCMNCHQGRSSGKAVKSAAGDLPGDEVADSLRFTNVHYFAAGATRFGADVNGGYEFDGKEYVGAFAHVESYQSCTSCHDAHLLEVKAEDCAMCHAGSENLEDIRMSDVDYDGNGDVTEGIAHEIEHLASVLYESMQAYSTDVVGTGLVYDSHSYPYFFIDTDGDGQPGADEAVRANSFATWTPNLVKAAYNYQYALKDPGGFAHNPKYIIQMLYDSIDAVGGDVSGFTRP